MPVTPVNVYPFSTSYTTINLFIVLSFVSDIGFFLDTTNFSSIYEFFIPVISKS